LPRVGGNGSPAHFPLFHYYRRVVESNSKMKNQLLTWQSITDFRYYLLTFAPAFTFQNAQKAQRKIKM
jgi:hypothetical protein